MSEIEIPHKKHTIKYNRHIESFQVYSDKTGKRIGGFKKLHTAIDYIDSLSHKTTNTPVVVIFNDRYKAMRGVAKKYSRGVVTVALEGAQKVNVNASCVYLDDDSNHDELQFLDKVYDVIHVNLATVDKIKAYLTPFKATHRAVARGK